ncbi:hypothetical protein AKO1_007860 [Acrasis kona]|uniref:RRP15-like protein n=1 Tax=Acrasis kona TaxID=1008807 RepID=A0AAW2YP69_9EUKA
MARPSKKQKTSQKKEAPKDAFVDDASEEDEDMDVGTEEEQITGSGDEDSQQDDDDEDLNDEYDLDDDEENDNTDNSQKAQNDDTEDTEDEENDEDEQDDSEEEDDIEDINKLKNKADKKKKKKKTKKVAREAGLNVKETQEELSQHIAKIMGIKVEDKNHLKSAYPVLAKAKGKARSLMTQLEKWKKEETENLQKKTENTIILEKNHTVPTLATYANEKMLSAVATQGVVKLLNHVMESKRKAKEGTKEKKYDDAYEILKKFEGNKYLQF